jgi:membrane-bound lytic murein transglycosylase MltF
VEQWRPLVATYFGDIPGAVDICLCLMARESGGNPDAYNPSGASGLMQVLSGWADNFGYTPADLFNPSVNLAIARALYDDGGWKHWSPWLRGACHDV